MCIKINNKVFFKIFVLFSFFFYQDIAVAKETNITILTFADVYNLNPSKYGGGLLSLKRIIQHEKTISENPFILVSGDVLSTNGIEKKTKGKTIIKLLNQFDIDLACLGNHEFAFDLDELYNRIRESNFVWLASNIREINDIPLKWTKPYKIYHIDNLKIAFLGITTPSTPTHYPKECNERLNFLPIIGSTEKIINELKKQDVDLIVALTHLDIEQDKTLASRFPEIKVIVGGHDHFNVSLYNGQTLIHKAGSDGAYIGKINIKILKNNIKNNTKIYLSWSTIANIIE